MRVRTLVAALLCASLKLSAQQPELGVAPLGALCAIDATAGSATEATLLAAALVGRERVSSLLRPLLAADVDSLVVLARHLGASADGRCSEHWVRPVVRTMYSTSTARAARDGAIWQGRGATVSLAGGYAMEAGPFTFALRPIAYAAENRGFVPGPVPAVDGDFRDPAWGHEIDLPYRHGEKPVFRIDPGESFVRGGWKGLGLAVSTASQHWGPAHHYPLLVGSEGASYPRAALEAREVWLGIGTATAEWQVGLLEASPYTKLPVGGRSRVSSALTASFAPAGLDGLELGGGRFFHVRREPGTLSWSTATLPFSGLVKTQSRDVRFGGFNQLASIFARIAPPSSGIELFGEYSREDHNADTRDLIGEPDHISAYVIGLSRTFATTGRLHRLHVEYANARISHLARVRPQNPVYLHGRVAEGHTFRGQPIGSAGLLGGGGLFASWSRIAMNGADEWSYEFRRGVQNNAEGGTWNRRPNGSHIFRWLRTFTRRNSLYSVVAESELGAGGRPSNGSVGFGWRPRCWVLGPCR